MTPPLTFRTPSIVGDSPEACAKAERDFKKIVREAIGYFETKRVTRLVQEVTKMRRGKKPNRSLNLLVLAEWDAAVEKDETKFSQAFYEKHAQGHSARAVEKRLERLLRVRVKDERLKAALQRPCLIGTK